MSSPLSGFTAVPNPQMLAFMGAQSFIMMYQAGEGWQYGKRKQSAMSNEEFNKQTPLSIMQNQAATLKTAIGTIETSMNDMTPMIRTIVSQYGDFLKEIISVAPPVLQSVSAEVVKEVVKQSTGQDITLAQALAIAQGLFGPARSILEKIFPPAEAQVPSAGLPGQETFPVIPPPPVGPTAAQLRAQELAGQYRAPQPTGSSTFFKPKTTFAQDQEALRIRRQKEENARLAALHFAQTKNAQLKTAIIKSIAANNILLQRAKTFVNSLIASVGIAASKGRPTVILQQALNQKRALVSKLENIIRLQKLQLTRL